MSNVCKCKSYSHFFSKNISKYSIFNNQKFNNTFTNDMASFEQLGPDIFHISFQNIDCGYPLELPQKVPKIGSNKYPKSLF